MSLSRETGPIRRAIALLALPAVLATSGLLAAPAQAATPTSSAAAASLSVAALPQIVPDSSVGMVSACAFAQMSPLGRIEVLVLILNGPIASAEARLQPAILKCVTLGLLPASLGALAARKAAASAIVAAFRLHQLCIPRCV